MRTQLSANAAVLACQHTHVHVRMEGKSSVPFLFFSPHVACMCPHLGQSTLLLCVLKVNWLAVTGIGRQAGTNWHEWAWQRALCG